MWVVSNQSSHTRPGRPRAAPGRPGAAAAATSPRLSDLAGAPATWTRPPASSKSAGSASSSSAAVSAIRSRRAVAARWAALPVITVTRLAKAPSP